MSAKFMVRAEDDVAIVTIGVASAMEAQATASKLRVNQFFDVTVRNEYGVVVNDAELGRLAGFDAEALPVR